MKIAAIILCGLSLPLTVSAQEVHSSPCDLIAKLDADLSQYRQQLAKLYLTMTDKHPQVIAMKENIETLEKYRATAAAQAASQGVVCSGSEPRKENAPPQAESTK